MTNRAFAKTLIKAAAVGFTLTAALSAQDQMLASAEGTMVVRAQVRPLNQTTISSELSSQVTQLPYEAGDSFKKGDLLAGLNCSILEAELKKARAVSDSANVKYTSVKRLQELSSVSILEVQLADGEKRAAKADVDIVQENIKNCRVLAPFTGRMMERYIDNLQFVRGGDPLFKIYESGTIEIDFLIPSSSLAWLKLDTQLWMDVEETGQTIQGTVSRLGSFVDPVSQTIQVRAKIITKDHNLLPGMSGNVRFQE